MKSEITENSALRLRGGGNLYNPTGCFMPPINAQFCPGYNMCNSFPSNCCNLPVIILTMPQYPPGPVPLSGDQPVPNIVSEGYVTPAQPIPVPTSAGAPRPLHRITPFEHPGRLEGVKKRIFPHRFSLPPINLASHIPQVSQKKGTESPDDPANAVINVELVPAQPPPQVAPPVLPKRPRKCVRPCSKISDSAFEQPPFHSSAISPKQPPAPQSFKSLMQSGSPSRKPPAAESFKSLMQSESTPEQSIQEQLHQSVAESPLEYPWPALPSQVTQLEAMLENEPYMSTFGPGFHKTLKTYPLDKSQIGDITRRRAHLWNQLKDDRSILNKDVKSSRDKEARIKAIQQQPDWRQDEAERKRVADLLQAFFKQRRHIIERLWKMKFAQDEFVETDQLLRKRQKEIKP